MAGGGWEGGGHTLLAHDSDSLWDMGDGGVVACASESVLTGVREVLAREVHHIMLNDSHWRVRRSAVSLVCSVVLSYGLRCLSLTLTLSFMR